MLTRMHPKHRLCSEHSQPRFANSGKTWGMPFGEGMTVWQIRQLAMAFAPRQPAQELPWGSTSGRRSEVQTRCDRTCSRCRPSTIKDMLTREARPRFSPDAFRKVWSAVCAAHWKLSAGLAYSQRPTTRGQKSISVSSSVGRPKVHVAARAAACGTLRRRPAQSGAGAMGRALSACPNFPTPWRAEVDWKCPVASASPARDRRR